MAHVVLQRPRIMAVIGQLKAAGMPQHMNVDREAEQARSVAQALHQLIQGVGRHRAAALRGEDKV